MDRKFSRLGAPKLKLTQFDAWEQHHSIDFDPEMFNIFPCMDWDKIFESLNAWMIKN